MLIMAGGCSLKTLCKLGGQFTAQIPRHCAGIAGGKIAEDYPAIFLAGLSEEISSELLDEFLGPFIRAFSELIFLGNI